MKTRAAVMTAPGKDWEITELELDAPRAGEVLVRFTHAGLCYSDEHVRTGNMATLPIIGGHEGSGIVEAVGEGVSRVAPGDHVAASFKPSCGHCRWCAGGRSNLCDAATGGPEGRLPDGTFRFTGPSGRIGANCALGTFAEHSVVSQNSLVRVDPAVPLSVVALVSCGVLTGWGAAVYAAEPQPGDTVIVVGAGGVGINAVQGARFSGAGNVILVDPNEAKHPLALELGASHTCRSLAEAAALAADLNPSAAGADSTIVCTGETTAEIVRASFEATGKGGTVVLAGMSEDVHDINIQLPGTQLVFAEKRIQGTIFGSCSPTRDIPRVLSLYGQGLIRLDELVSRTYGLDEINQGFEDLRCGRNLRGVVEHRPAD
ncbi:Zn-dependent alcohol dehydrogenase [Peterkaempfera bronchialis]|uniref:NDMA-dependent alcohol dehydrogenase n=1 Tax=Peterkaempfera bronchialis TaxID=2126346 RepID=A0A345T4S7_9ACTN|nr:Zn-dependent alcohol dehydrogenase [Peterkaempfera bronchialis]AXI80982.1 NDMA-dependent alcohol dehydrogenase [Peterkaempfera bronchialis]